ncbi:hypothetical protein [Arenimonas terrae]|uniref:Uncharacterized protein n=1 Tax=Arenimonas terrae TaxID=2546226 RepID=A0A5C4RUG5_9GAMM|nr:hypothetical protein [Arenimonas terrae]TNJ34287.1 hypothetical protein E1B00_00380 [Arenimonas terrae]
MRKAWLLPLLMWTAGTVSAASELPADATPPAETPEAPAAAKDALDPETAEMCTKIQCLLDVRITMRDEKGKPFDKHYPALPVVQPGGVSVYAGHEVLIEAEVENGRLVNLRRVEEVSDPSRTLHSRLEQDEDGSMMLITRNPFDKALRIRMGMMPMGHDGLVRTSSCPVRPGSSTYEMWPMPIFQIYLADMRLIEEDEDMGCVE